LVRQAGGVVKKSVSDDRQTGKAGDAASKPEAECEEGPMAEMAGAARAAGQSGARTFLVQELGGATVDGDEVVGIGFKDLFQDPQLRRMGIRLWKQMHGQDVVDETALKEASLTINDIFQPGLSECVTSSSTKEEIDRYRLKLEFRADMLEALLDQTIAELESLSHLRPADDVGGEDGGLEGAGDERKTTGG
jgi:hypothetical protein